MGLGVTGRETTVSHVRTGVDTSLLRLQSDLVSVWFQTQQQCSLVCALFTYIVYIQLGIALSGCLQSHFSRSQ